MRRNFSVPFRTESEAHTTVCEIGSGSLFPGQSGSDEALTTHPGLAPKLKKEERYKA
jgi:hypothetical protein